LVLPFAVVNDIPFQEPAVQIHVYFHEVPDDRWGRGGVLASDRPAEPVPDNAS
jgi:phenylpyruvate tautomerase PptA (4-oxalocrotonate tautomerase family)